MYNNKNLTYTDEDIRRVLMGLYTTTNQATSLARNIGLQRAPMLPVVDPEIPLDKYWSRIWEETKILNKELTLIKRARQKHWCNKELRRIQKHLIGVDRPWWWIVLSMMIIMILGSGGGYAIFLHFHSSPTGIGVTQIGNESIGISDGSFAFDTTLTDGSLKTRAAQVYRQNSNNVNPVTSLLNQATAINSNDAEALIYQEDLTVVNSGKPYVTIVVATILSGVNLGVGRDDLQGAYVVQKEFNDRSELYGGVQVHLLIANTGSKLDYVSNITQQIIQLAQTDKTFVGVMGWPISRYTIAAIDTLSKAHIPLVSQTSSVDKGLTGKPYFFRVVPSDEQQGIQGANYAINTLHKKNVALFYDSRDPYSNELQGDFRQEFQKDGGQLAVEEKYTVGDPGSLSSELQDALNHHPDLIYFSGYP
ncbi:MAG TPA: ABC transporter substrate-binding protein, partial [Ktedonobacteraceae bacterium]